MKFFLNRQKSERKGEKGEEKNEKVLKEERRKNLILFIIKYYLKNKYLNKKSEVLKQQPFIIFIIIHDHNIT